MARPNKNTVDYFPHDCTHKKTIYILKNRYGNEGYAFWFQLLELLGKSEGHFINCNDTTTWLFLTAETGINDDKKTLDILNLLAEMHAIDKKLWKHKIIWSQNFVERLADVYHRRKIKIPQKPIIDSKNRVNVDKNPINDSSNPQSKVKESKVKENKKTARFKKPTIEQIRAYCIERDNGIDPEAFYDFYESKDWMIGKNKMKDWKAAVRTWEKRHPKPERNPLTEV
jgi:hypothetical protein